MFAIVDKDGSGYLSRREAKRACKLIGEKFGIMEVKWRSTKGKMSYRYYDLCLGGELAGSCRCGRRWAIELRRVQDEHRWQPSHRHLRNLQGTFSIIVCC